MLPGARVAAAIAVLSDWSEHHRPLKTCLADWGKAARYAGAKDRAFVSGLALDALRRQASFAAAMGSPAPRALALAALRWSWGWSVEAIAAAFAAAAHGPDALTDGEAAALAAPAPPTALEAPDWAEAALAASFGPMMAAELAALATRAPVDLRVNLLKTTPEKALAQVAAIGGEAHPWLTTAVRVPAPASPERGSGVEAIPAYAKGWVEVQDLGSQIAALAAGDIDGAQVLDFCAGGGGKTLALAAMMGNRGQLYAYDKDARRLMPAWARLQRAGVRNAQMRAPAGGAGIAVIEDLAGKMDVVFVDAPCTGAGTWRRKPDTKWRLTPEQLERRVAEQDAALAQASRFVREGGALIYVVCSIFAEEGSARIAHFLRAHPAFAAARAIDAILARPEVTEAGRQALLALADADGNVLLSPLRAQSDGFFIARLERRS